MLTSRASGLTAGDKQKISLGRGLVRTKVNAILFDEPLKFTAKLRDYKTDNNLLLLKTEMAGGHGGKTGRDSGIEEIAFDYSFILKMKNL